MPLARIMTSDTVLSPPSSTPSPADYSAGVVIGGKYRLERLLGEGGMGSVWAAENTALGSAVAIKVIRGDTNREDMGLRLLQEARAAARLGHPSIVRVFDIGNTDRGDPFIVMELLEGESLAVKVAREWRLSATEAVQILLPIADALGAAHAKSIVHRDIKPDNVFLVPDGGSLQPKLVDFGIAKHEQHEANTHRTQHGVVVGSPDYMSPEQARGEERIDHRSDIWSFCVVLYEVVTGNPPFEGANYNALLNSILQDKPKSLAELSAADQELSRIVELGLAKDRVQRWQSMQELGTALAHWLIQQGIFEDAGGGSLEAKWVNRRTDPAYRYSRPSLGSLPGTPASGTTPAPAWPDSAPGSGSGPRGRPVASESPTSVGPVVTGAERRVPRRLLLPAAGVLTIGALLFLLLRPSSDETTVHKDTSPSRPAAAAPALAQPEPVGPLAVPEPAPPRVPATAAEAPEPSAVTSAKRRAPVERPRGTAQKPGGTAKTQPKPGLDLMTPY